jgi:hypothetical protein
MPYEHRSAKHHLHAFMDIMVNPQLYFFLLKSCEVSDEVKKNEHESLPLPSSIPHLDL